MATQVARLPTSLTKPDGAQRFIITLINLILVVLIAYQLAQLTWRFTAPEPEPQTRQQTIQQASAKHAAEHNSAEQIAALQLFGKVETQRVVTPQPMEQAPPTRLNLILRGLLAAASEATARAIIEAPGSGEHLYTVGDELPGGATLHQIENDHVVLERNGRLETLHLPKHRNTAATKPRSSSASRSTSTQRVDQRSSRAMTNIVREYRERLSSDLSTLSQRINLSPVNQNGSFKGFRINRIDSRERKLRQLGLRRGDTITAVNGIALDNPMRGMEVLQNLNSATELQIDILRNGSQKTFLYRVE
ncbi:type II secretion system protein GspC [Solemya pervernicosa gill symbiont]|uniref:Type II secretion system protein GspC n=2 Tax=Gammaproteobacteria incertae sedis TaxID=118884 RepID=A0A1T2L9H9_9GAMM|nr:type II secretion system protein GspC [Solemya pervernicosa gill symbiont]OOZ41586.1 type II secretion system protein GspC [Solemya pervernicosa gill symbiont]